MPCLAVVSRSVVASALGIPALLPFLKAVCLSKKSWQARHTGIKIVQQIAILMGCAVLPHLKALVDIVKHGLQDENQKVITSRGCHMPCPKLKRLQHNQCRKLLSCWASAHMFVSTHCFQERTAR